MSLSTAFAVVLVAILVTNASGTQLEDRASCGETFSCNFPDRCCPNAAGHQCVNGQLPCGDGSRSDDAMPPSDDIGPHVLGKKGAKCKYGLKIQQCERPWRCQPSNCCGGDGAADNDITAQVLGKKGSKCSHMLTYIQCEEPLRCLQSNICGEDGGGDIKAHVLGKKGSKCSHLQKKIQCEEPWSCQKSGICDEN